MNKKQIYIGLGILAVAGLGIYLYKRSTKKEEKKSGFIKAGPIRSTQGKSCVAQGCSVSLSPSGSYICDCNG